MDWTDGEKKTIQALNLNTLNGQAQGLSAIGFCFDYEREERKMKKLILVILVVLLISPLADALTYNLIDLGPGLAHSINNKGQIVGTLMDTAGVEHAMLYDATGRGNNIDLGTLPGGSFYQREARSINDKGQIVGGTYSDAFRNCRATLFDTTGGSNHIILCSLISAPESINNNGEIVGWSYIGGINYRATLFDATGGGNNLDLNTLIDPTLGWNLYEAISINDNGWIVGRSANSGAFLLIPNPEPCTLMLLGLGGLLIRKR